MRCGCRVGFSVPAFVSVPPVKPAATRVSGDRKLEKGEYVEVLVTSPKRVAEKLSVKLIRNGEELRLARGK